MARRRRTRRHKRRRKSRITGGKLAIGAVLLLALLYFTFTQLFFDPFEEPQREFNLLVPRDVGLFVRRERLATDFSSFPRLREVERLMQTSSWRALAQTPWFQQQQWPVDLAEQVTRLEQQLEQAPLDVLADVLGEELALVGRHVGAADDYALLARLSNKGKLAVESLGSDAVLQKAFPGATQEKRTDPGAIPVTYYQLTLPDGEPLFYGRITDLLVLGNDEELVRDVLRTTLEGADRSLGLSRLYMDHLPPPGGQVDQRFSTELVLDAESLARVLELNPDTEDRREDALANILPRVVDTTLIRDAVGRLELDRGRLHVRLHGELDVGRAREDRGGLLGQPIFPVHERLGEVLELLPGNTAAALSMNVSLRRFLMTVKDGLDPEFLRLMNETLVQVARYNPSWRVDNVVGLIEQLDAALEGQITVAMRQLDHDVDPGVQPLPALAFIMPVADRETWNQMEQAFLRGYRALGLDSDRMFQLDEGVGYRKWFEVPGLPMEEISWILLDRETLILCTDSDFLSDIVEVYTGSRDAVTKQADARALLAAFQEPAGFTASANVAGWLNAEELLSLIQPYGQYVAELDTVIDFAVERARLQAQIIAREHPSYRGREDELPESDLAALNTQLDEQLDAMEAKRLETEVPALAAAWLEGFSWMTLLRDAAFSLRLGDRSVEVELHVAAITAP